MRILPGSDVSQTATVKQALAQAGMDYEFEMRPMQTPGLAGGFRMIDVPDFRCVVRTDTDAPLAVVGARYGLIQPLEAFDVFDGLRDTGVSLTRLASYDNGRKLTGTGIVPITVEPRVGDIVNLEVWVRASVDGSTTHEVGARAMRLKCTNGQTVKVGNGKIHKIRHSGNVQGRLHEVKGFIREAILSFREYGQIAAALDKRIMRLADVQEMAVALIPDPKGANPAKAESKRMEIVHLFSNGQGNEGRTAWDALNAVTEWTNWAAPTRTGEDGRWAASQWGDGATLNDQALQYLQVYAGA